MMPAALQNIVDRLTAAWRDRAIALKAAAFAVVGVVNSIIDFSVFSFSYYYLGLPIVVSNTLAWAVAVSGSYVMNSTITFAAESGRKLHLKGYLGFALSQVMGFLAVYESYALYAEGAFGTIPELYVRPTFRSQGVGARLLAEVRQFATSRGWTRLEVTTPPLTQFERTLAFYERHNFSISGGRKMKTDLP